MLEARDITFAYSNSRTIFQDLNFAVTPGERIALKAPSGSGKTTLCSLLAGYLRPARGEILLDGRPLPHHGVRPIQMILQHPESAMDPRMRMAATLAEAGIGTGHEHTLDERTISEEHRALLRRLGIRDPWLRRFPHELSGGELQRFCIARALAVRPRYLIADEISTMLDAVTQARIWHVLLEEVERSEIGLIFVSHSPALTEHIATRIVELGDQQQLHL